MNQKRYRQQQQQQQKQNKLNPNNMKFQVNKIMAKQYLFFRIEQQHQQQQKRNKETNIENVLVRKRKQSLLQKKKNKNQQYKAGGRLKNRLWWVRVVMVVSVFVCIYVFAYVYYFLGCKHNKCMSISSMRKSYA